jgi:hypothetical protein
MAFPFFEILSAIVIIASVFALYRFVRMLIFVFGEPEPVVPKMAELDLSGSPEDVAKRYFLLNPYVVMKFQNKNILVRDGGCGSNVSEELAYINSKVFEIVKALNGERPSTVVIETEKEYMHHVLVELLYRFVEVLDRHFDNKGCTSFCVPHPSGKGYISTCQVV